MLIGRVRFVLVTLGLVLEKGELHDQKQSEYVYAVGYREIT
jgi:hypothetical protein